MLVLTISSCPAQICTSALSSILGLIFEWLTQDSFWLGFYSPRQAAHKHLWMLQQKYIPEKRRRYVWCTLSQYSPWDWYRTVFNSPFWSLFYLSKHTHTHTQIKRGRQREGRRELSPCLLSLPSFCAATFFFGKHNLETFFSNSLIIHEARQRKPQVWWVLAIWSNTCVKLLK